MEIENWASGVSETDLTSALTQAAEGVMIPFAHYPPVTTGFTMADRIRAHRGVRYAEAMGRVRQRDIDVEMDWLAENNLFRGEPPIHGELWNDYVERIGKKQRVANESRGRGKSRRMIREEVVEPPVPAVYDGVPLLMN